MNKKCARGDHKFKPRYDVERRFPPGLNSIKGWGTPSYIEAMKETKTTYIYDICVRCGQRIMRDMLG